MEKTTINLRYDSNHSSACYSPTSSYSFHSGETMKLINEQENSFNYEGYFKSLEDYIIKMIQLENQMTLIEKITFTKYIIFNRLHLIDLNDFYEEECHLSLLNWLWTERLSIKANNNAKLLELLYNILIIFEILPIRSQDLIGLNLFEKLNKIKGYVSKTNPDIALRIQNLLNYWKIHYELITESKMLSKKHERTNETDTEAESEETLVVEWKKRKLAPEKMKKSVTIDLNLNTIIYYDKESEPIQISKRSEYDYDPIKCI